MGLWDVDVALKLAEELYFNRVEVVQLGYQLIAEGGDSDLEVHLVDVRLNFHY